MDSDTTHDGRADAPQPCLLRESALHPCQPDSGEPAAVLDAAADSALQELLREPLAAVHRALRGFAEQAAEIVRKQEEDARSSEVERLRAENGRLQEQLSQIQQRAGGGKAWDSAGYMVALTARSRAHRDRSPAPSSRPSRVASARSSPAAFEVAPPTSAPPLLAPLDEDFERDVWGPGRSETGVNKERSDGRRKSIWQQAATLADFTRHVQYFAMFPDPDEMKDKVRTAMAPPGSNVADSLKEAGWAQRVARSVAFEYATLFVIGVNAIWIAIDADLNIQDDPRDAEPYFLVMDQLFCTYFTFEIVVRFLAKRVRWSVLKDSWFLFDSCLVVLTITDTWVMMLIILLSGSTQNTPGGTVVLRLFRLLRLTRMARLIRLVRAVPELMVLLKGMKAAARSVALTLTLLTTIIYVFAILLRQITDGTELGRQYFATVPAAMSSLLLRGTLPDQADFVIDSGHESYIYGFVLLVFILLGSLTVMNMLIGILVQVVSAIAAAEQEEMSTAAVKSLMGNIMEKYGVDTNGDRCISLKEFELLLSIPEAVKVMVNFGVDVVGLVDDADFIFEGGSKELSFGDFFMLLQHLRGRNAATVKDIVDLRKFVVQAVTHPQSLTKTNPRAAQLMASVRATAQRN